MKNTKSPVLIYDNVISPLLCEELIDTLGFPIPISTNESTLDHSVTSDLSYEEIVYSVISPYIPLVEKYYNFTHKGTTSFQYEWIPQTAIIPVHAENSEYIDNNWVKTKSRDFTCIIFLSEYNKDADFDADYECCGGNLEFINHQFSIHPSRGSMIVFPSDPRFANATSKVMVGDAYQIRFHFVATQPWIYQPTDFPGNHKTWF